MKRHEHVTDQLGLILHGRLIWLVVGSSVEREPRELVALHEDEARTFARSLHEAADVVAGRAAT